MWHSEDVNGVKIRGGAQGETPTDQVNYENTYFNDAQFSQLPRKKNR